MEGGIGCGELPRSAFCGYHASDSKSTGTRNSPDEAFDSLRAARLFRRHAIPCGATQAAQNDSRQGQGGRLSILPLVDHVEGAGSAYDGRPIVGIGSTYGRMAIRDRGRAGLPRRGLCASFATLLCGPGLSSSRPLSAVRGLLAIRRHVRRGGGRVDRTRLGICGHGTTAGAHRTGWHAGLCRTATPPRVAGTGEADRGESAARSRAVCARYPGLGVASLWGADR